MFIQLIRSVIVTGCSSWTVYEYNNYQGGCACLNPSDFNNCYPGLYTSLDNLSNQISSARRGCYCNRVLTPEKPIILKDGKKSGEFFKPATEK